MRVGAQSCCALSVYAALGRNKIAPLHETGSSPSGRQAEFAVRQPKHIAASRKRGWPLPQCQPGWKVHGWADCVDITLCIQFPIS